MINVAKVQGIKNLVGLLDGQRRTEALRVACTRRSGWYNNHGEWIGWGDLSGQDMQDISVNLKENESFFVLHEEDAFLKFLRNLVPDASRIVRNEDAPGLDYIATHALFIIEMNAIYRVHHVHPSRPAERQNGIAYQVIDSNMARAKILGKEKADSVC